MNFKGIKKSVQKNVLVIALYDILFIAFSGLLSFAVGSIIVKKASFMQNYTNEQVQNMILNNPESGAAFVSMLKMFVFTYITGVVIMGVLILLAFTFTRVKIWNLLLNKKFDKKKYWKWNALVLLLAIPSLLYLFIMALIKLLIVGAVSNLGNQILVTIIDGLTVLSLSLIYFFTIFLIYYNFSKKYKVWESIGDTFHLIKVKWSKMWRTYLTVLVVSLIAFLILSIITYFLPYDLLNTILAVVLLILLLAWTRVILLQEIHK